jgi:hypothetical protein
LMMCCCLLLWLQLWCHLWLLTKNDCKIYLNVEERRPFCMFHPYSKYGPHVCELHLWSTLVRPMIHLCSIHIFFLIVFLLEFFSFGPYTYKSSTH